jgi:ADP-heptose:LPS heptosyltransferase
MARRLLSRRAASPPRVWKNLALVGADHIGDVLYRTVGLADLKAGLGGCRLHFVASNPAAELLETHPALDSVIVAEKPIERRAIADRVRLLRGHELDAVLCFDAGAYWKDQLAVALAGIPNCAGYEHKGFRGLATRALPFCFPQPYAESFRSAVESVIERPVPCDLRPAIHLTGEDIMVGESYLQECRRGRRPVLAVGVTGNQPQGELLKERMLETVSALARSQTVTVAFLGAPSDFEEIEQRRARWSIEGINLCGKLRLRESIAFLKGVDAVFAVDSGLRHMANAAGALVVYFRNLFTFKGETGNYLPTEIDIAPDVECLSRETLATNPPLFDTGYGVSVLAEALARGARI